MRKSYWEVLQNCFEVKGAYMRSVNERSCLANLKCEERLVNGVQWLPGLEPICAPVSGLSFGKNEKKKDVAEA